MIHIMLKLEKHYSKAQLTSRYKYVLDIGKIKSVKPLQPM